MTQVTPSSSPLNAAVSRGRSGVDRARASGSHDLLFAHPKTASIVVLVTSLVLGLLSAWALDVRVAAAALALPPWIRALAGWITLLGLSNYMLIISALSVLGAILVFRRHASGALRRTALDVRERAAFFFVAVAGSGIAAQLVKHVVGRARPKLFDTLGAFHFDLFSIKASLASLPSGHATSAFAAATALGAMLPRWRRPLYALACLIAASRVAVGAHYASDVIVGATLGVLFTIGLAACFASRGWAFEWRGGSLALHDWNEGRRDRRAENNELEPSA